MHHGMLTIYKEKGYTSSDAVARLRGILRMRKIGHTGTLDPDAEGVLPMCLGNATRICELIADREKEYLAVMRLGVLTDTQDMSGEILSQVPEDRIREILLKDERIAGGTEDLLGDERIAGGTEELLSDKPISGCTQEEDRIVFEKILAAASSFTGEIEQIPPMYSAVKVNGKRLYDMARKGITVERKPRRITIYSLQIEEVNLPLVRLRVRCSKGTYIRTLCEDLGNALGVGAAMQSLLRTRVGQFTLDEALTLDEVERIAKTEPEKLPGLIRPVDSFFADLPAAECTDEALRLLKNGNVLTVREIRFLKPDEDPLGSPSGGAVRQDDAGTGLPDDGGTGSSGSPASKSSGGEEARSSLPGIAPREQVIRMYDREGRFFGLYRSGPDRKGRGRYQAYKMFLPQE